MNGERKCDNEILFSHNKEGNIAIYSSMDKNRGHCAKWNKPGREWQVLFVYLHLEFIKNKKVNK